MGDFFYDDSMDSPECVFLWGVGSGITPLISLTKQLLSATPEIKVKLIYGNRSHESTIFANLINELLKNYPDRFTAWHFYTQPVLSLDSDYVVVDVLIRRVHKN